MNVSQNHSFVNSKDAPHQRVDASELPDLELADDPPVWEHKPTGAVEPAREPAAKALTQRDTAREHIQLLTGSPDTAMWFRFFDDNTERKDGTLAGKLYGTVAECWPEIERRQDMGCGVFIVVNPGGNRAAEITSGRAQFVDADGIPRPSSWHVPPNFIVSRDETHWHAYWRVADVSPAQFTTAQKRLAAHYGTDKRVHDPSRVMRLAGTWHHKDICDPKLVMLAAGASGVIKDVLTSIAELPEDVESVEAVECREPAKPIEGREAVTLARLIEVLSYLDPEDRDDWIKACGAIKGTVLRNGDNATVAEQWSRGEFDRAGRYADAPPDTYDPKDMMFNSGSRWRGLDCRAGFATLVWMAKQHGYEPPSQIPETTGSPADTFGLSIRGAQMQQALDWAASGDSVTLEFELTPEMERQAAADKAAGKTMADLITEYGVAPERTVLSRFGFGGRKPSEGKNLPELVYFDRRKTLPRVPNDGCVGLAIGQWHSHKTGTLLKYGLDACDAGYRVLFVAAEDSHGIEKMRLPAAIAARGRPEDHYDDLWITEGASLILRSKEYRDDLMQAYHARGFIPDLIFIDVLAKTIPGADVNSAQDVGQIVCAMEELAKGFGGATVLATRHPPLSTQTRGTGSNEFPALVYFQWLITAEAGTVTVHVDKMKNGPADRDVRFKLSSGVPVLSDMTAEDEAEAKRRTVRASGPDPIIADAISTLVVGAPPISIGNLTRRLREIPHERYSQLAEGDLTTRIKLAVWGRAKKQGWSGTPSGPLAPYAAVNGAGTRHATYEFVAK
jgi:AAA domain/RepB DNA-primase from phage plasmid